MADSNHVILAHRNAIEAAAVAATSASSVTVGTGTKNFQVPSGTRFYVGAIATAKDAADPANWVRGPITGFTLAGAVEIDATSSGGSGTIDAWILTLDKWTGGDWALPLTQFDDKRLWQFARSADADPSSTRLVVDLGSPQTIQTLMMIAANLEVDAEARLVLFNKDAETGAEELVYETARFPFWPPDMKYGQVPWGELAWSGRSPALDAARATPSHFTRGMLTLGSSTSLAIGAGQKVLITSGPTETPDGAFVEGMPVAVTRASDWRTGFLGVVQIVEPNKLQVRVTDQEGTGTYDDWVIRALSPSAARQSYEARFAALHLFNPGHATGYLQAGALFLGPYTQPTRNIENGLRVVPVSRSRVARTPGGHLIGMRRRQGKRFEFSIGYLDRDEAFGTFFELQRAKDLLDPFIVMLDPSDSINAARWSMYGTLAELAPVEHIVGRYHRISMTMDEF